MKSALGTSIAIAIFCGACSKTPTIAPSIALTAPETETAGSSFSVSVGLTHGPLNGPIHFVSSDASATLPADLTLADAATTATVPGFTLASAGTQTITASSIGAQPATATVSVMTAAGTLVLSGPTSATAGVPLTVVVTVHDTKGAVDTHYTGTLSFTSSDGQAQLPSPYTFSAQDAGTHSFSATFFLAAQQTLTVSDGARLTASETITVASGPIASFRVSAPSPEIAGTITNVKAVALDAEGNIVASYGGTPVLTTTDPTAVVPPGSLDPDAPGSVDFAVQLKTAGETTLAVRDSHATGSVTIEVDNAPAALFVLTTPAAPIACQADELDVTVMDSFGNVAIDYTGTVHFSAPTDPTATLPDDYTFTPDDAGMHAFQGVILTTAGMVGLQATDDLDGVTGSATLPVTTGPAASLVVVAPSSVDEKVSFAATVSAQDACANAVPSYQGTVTLTSTDPAVPTLGSHTVSGSYQFTGLLLKTPGAQTIHASDGTLSGTASITVTPTGLNWVQQAGGAATYVEPLQIAGLADNSVVVAGLFSGTGTTPLDMPTFGLGTTNQTTLTPPSDTGQIFVARYGSDGSFLWAKQAGGSNDDHASGIRPLTDGTVLVTGSVTTTSNDGSTGVVFGEGETNQTSVSSTAGSVMYLARFNTSDGTLASVFSGGGSAQTDSISGQSIALYSDGSFTVCAQMTGHAAFGQGATATALDASTVETALVLAHFDSTRTFAWAKLYEGESATDQIYPSVCREMPDGGLIVVGGLAGTAIIGSKTLTSIGSADALIARFDQNGSPLWSTNAGVMSSNTNERSANATALVVDANGNAYVAGQFSGLANPLTIAFGSTTLTAATGDEGGFLVQYLPAGTVGWAKSISGTASDSAGRFAGLVLVNGSLIADGTYTHNIVFGVGESGETTLQRASLSDTNDEADLFLAGFDPTSGDVQWASRSAIGSGSMFFSGSTLSIGSTPSGEILVGAEFTGTGSFAPDDSSPVQFTGVGVEDMAIGAWWPY